MTEASRPASPEFLSAIHEAKSIVLITHRGPDGDGLGTEIALAEAFEAAGKKVCIVNEDPMPRRMRFLDPDGRIVVYRRAQAPSLREAELALLVDVSEIHRAGTPAEVRHKAGGAFLALDHHPVNGQSLTGHIVPESSSTAEIAFHLLKQLDMPLTPRAAEALYAGIVFDTMAFRFVRKQQGPFQVAAELVAAGADPEKVQIELFQTSKDYATLLGRLLPDLAFSSKGRVAVLAITGEHKKELKLDADEIHDVVNFLNSMRGVQVCAFLRQLNAQNWRVNLRCQEGLAIDAIARDLGGGGHPRASGATLRDVSKDEAVALVAKRLNGLFLSGNAGQ